MHLCEVEECQDMPPLAGQVKVLQRLFVVPTHTQTACKENRVPVIVSLAMFVYQSPHISLIWYMYLQKVENCMRQCGKADLP